MIPKIGRYRQQTSPGGLVNVQAGNAQLDTSEIAARMRFTGAVQQASAFVDRINEEEEEEARREEEENARIWTMQAVSNAALVEDERFDRLRTESQPGAAGLEEAYAAEFDERMQTILSLAPSDSAKKFTNERLIALRGQMISRARDYSRAERQRWRVETVGDSINNVAAVVAKDSSRVPVLLAEQRAVIDAMDIAPDQKAALRQNLEQQVSRAAVLGDIQRDPMGALRSLSARLGASVATVGVGEFSEDDSFGRMIQRESRGQQFGKDGKPLKSPVGATGIAQIMPETGPVAARMAGVKWDPERFETDPDYNLALGRAYYGNMVEQFGHPIVAAAAYNAGPGMVQDWINGTNKTGKNPSGRKLGNPATGEVDIEDWINAIPFKETREYAEFVAGGRSPKKVTSESPQGVAVGSVAYDLLSVQEVVSLIGMAESEANKKKAEAHSYVASRESDDLAAYMDGKQPAEPLTKQEFQAAFGKDWLSRWERYQSAASYSREMSGFQNKSNAEIVSVLQRKEPEPGPGYADRRRQYDAMRQAATAVLEVRSKDPVLASISAGTAKPLDFTDQDGLAEGLRARVGLAQYNTQKIGTPFRMLSNSEAQQLGAIFRSGTAAERGQLIKTIRANVSDPMAYQSLMGTVAPNSPVTALAGSLMAIPQGEPVAERMLAGEDLLKPSGGFGKVKLPEAELRSLWATYTGTAYAGFPKAGDVAYQSFRAYTVARLAETGVRPDEWSRELEDIADEAAAAVTGGVVELNDSQIVLPYGVEEDRAVNALEAAWSKVTRVPFDSIGLQTRGDGLYMVTAGAGPFRMNAQPTGQKRIGSESYNILSSGPVDVLQSRDGAIYLQYRRDYGMQFYQIPAPEMTDDIPAAPPARPL
jgi:soluble lytic murein transglycosylase